MIAVPDAISFGANYVSTNSIGNGSADTDSKVQNSRSGICLGTNQINKYGFLLLLCISCSYSNLGMAGEEAIEEIVVIGMRASLTTARDIKQGSLGIVDSIVAEDIHRLPDDNVSEALQRVTGVQISRERGEGNRSVVRGLRQTVTTLNGREMFSINDAEGYGRSLNLSTVSSNLISTIDVFKSASAKQVEGGIGGLIDIRTRRPLDSGDSVALAAKAHYGDLVEEDGYQISVLGSERWQTDNMGEFGVLLNVSRQERSYREDKKDTAAPIARGDIVAGETVFVPGGSSEYTNRGERIRKSINIVLQWQPTDSLELYAEGNYFDFLTLEDTHQLNLLVNQSTNFSPGSVQLFSGTQDIRSITWLDVPVSTLSFIRDTEDKSRQVALGAKWENSDWYFDADLSYTDSDNSLLLVGPILSTTVSSFRHDFGTDVPQTSVAGTDLRDPNNYQFSNLLVITRVFDGDMLAVQLDGEYEFEQGVVKSVSSGVRLTRRRADNEPGVTFDAGGAISGTPASARPDLITNYRYNYFSNSTGVGPGVIGDLGLARDVSAIRRAYGITSSLPDSGAPESLWDLEEDTEAVYALFSFEAGDFDGDAGVRIVRTRTTVSGNRSATASSSVEPIEADSDFTDTLPSLNVRYDLGQERYLRGSVSKTLSRQQLSRLSPSLSLFQFEVSPELNTGSAGNPDLKPVRADNLDLAVENYFGATGLLYVTGFWKNVDGFITTVSAPEIYDGVTYQVSRPKNTSHAKIRGVEFGYQQFYDFLPGPWQGLGLLANFTYVHSQDASLISGESLPLQDLSKRNLNIVAMYEIDQVGARIAYNWRDRFLSGITQIVNVGNVPIYSDSYGWLDASLSYRVRDNISVTIEANNLLNSLRTSEYSATTRPQRGEITDRQINLGARIRF